MGKTEMVKLNSKNVTYTKCLQVTFGSRDLVSEAACPWECSRSPNMESAITAIALDTVGKVSASLLGLLAKIKV